MNLRKLTSNEIEMLRKCRKTAKRIQWSMGILGVVEFLCVLVLLEEAKGWQIIVPITFSVAMAMMFKDSITATRDIETIDHTLKTGVIGDDGRPLV